MAISSQKDKTDLDSRIRAAETIRAMGLFTEAIEAYQGILENISGLEEKKKKEITDTIETIKKESEKRYQEEISEISSKDLNLIRKTLSTGQTNISQILSSANALKELGLYKEAATEYKKLFDLDYPRIKIISELLECYAKSLPPNEVLNKIKEIMLKYDIKGSEKSQIDNMLADELEKRGDKRLSQDYFKNGEKTEDPEGEFISKQYLDAAPAADATPEKKSSHLLAQKTDKSSGEYGQETFRTQTHAEKIDKSSEAPGGYSQKISRMETIAGKTPKKPAIADVAPSGSKYDYLIDSKQVNIEKLQRALALSKKFKKSVEYILVEQFKINKKEVGKSLSIYSGCPFKDFNPKTIVPYELITNLKKAFLLNDIWIPMGWDKNGVEILVDDPRDLIKTDRIAALIKSKKINFSVGIREDIEAYINLFFEHKDREDKNGSGVTDDGFNVFPDISFEEEEHEVEEKDIVDESSSKVVRLVDQVLVTAYRDNISDIHVEPSPVTRKTLIRYRRDGVCHEYVSVPINVARAILSRIKIMANLDIAERRLPQDGKIKFKRKGIPEFELRVATLPTTGGYEDAVLRILAKAGAMPLDDMLLTERNLGIIKKIISQPYGLFLVVGPTGSGKTTTLHAALGHINKPGIKIWTAEDPVEISQVGLRQVEVKPKIGLDFARVMRAFLRADPDVIMIGEMRDYETASTGIEASLTGHLVFSTLHTNNAPETITRLLDMGLNPLNFSDAFRGVLAQRLVRRLCKECRKQYHPSKEEFDELVQDFGREAFESMDFKYSPDFVLYKGEGCDVCNGTGYRGRMGIHEMMEGTSAIKRLIKKQSSGEELFKQAALDGMHTLKQDGILKVLKGYTDMNEVRRVCIE